MPQLLASELSASALSDSSGHLPNLLLGKRPVELQLAHVSAMTMSNCICDEAQPQTNFLLPIVVHLFRQVAWQLRC